MKLTPEENIFIKTPTDQEPEKKQNDPQDSKDQIQSGFVFKTRAIFDLVWNKLTSVRHALQQRLIKPVRNATHLSNKEMLYKIYSKLPPKMKRWVKKAYHYYTHRAQARAQAHAHAHAHSEMSLDQELTLFIAHLREKINTGKSVFYVQPTLFNFFGVDFFLGGAERYAMDLKALFIKAGYEFYCLQYSVGKPWIRHYSGLTVIGLPSFYDQNLFNQCVSLLTQHSELVISSPFTLVKENSAKKIIGISHGIYWDHESLHSMATNIAHQVKTVDRLAAVDTATINFIRSHNAAYSDKMDYIPNYVDHDVFKPTPQNSNVSSSLTVLYPRRLCEPRGFWVVCKIIPAILQEFDQVTFLFCGTGGDQERKEVSKLQLKYKDRIKYLVSHPQNMNKVYEQADIVLIPTVYSEGTSLSLIEAMASKKAIIATCVGGLTDLVTDRFTGLLIKPGNEAQLHQAIRELIVNPELREYLAKNAYEKSFAFSIHLWEKKWIDTLREVLEPPTPPETLFFRKWSFIHLSAEGILFDCMRQRPQQLFLALSKKLTCFFVEDRDQDTQTFINKNLVLSGKKTEIDLSGMIGYTYFAYNYPLLKDSSFQALIYDVLDNPSLHNSPDYLREHTRLLNKADVILTSSEILFNEYKNHFQNKKIIKYVPNAVALEDFHHLDRTRTTQPNDFPTYSTQTIGYYGAISEWMDYELIDRLCSELKEAQILLIGPCRTNFPEKKELHQLLQSHKNLFHLNMKPYCDLLHYAVHFDVSIIPFLENEITRDCSPVKLFEYMALGKPIVSTDLPECRQYQSALTAENHDEFIQLTKTALTIPNDSEYFQTMKREAEDNTWEKRTTVIIEALNEHFNSKR